MMKNSTPVIMGILLILGITALGYFGQFDNQTNNSSNNSFNHSLLGNKQFTIQDQSTQPATDQQTTDSGSSTTNNTVQNTTSSDQNQTTTSSGTSG
jgi:hypothetical protein